MEELELFNALKQGDNAAFEMLFRKYFKPLTAFANKYLNDLDEAQDLVQAVFVKLYEQREQLNIHTSLKSFLYQSVKNRCLDQIRMVSSRSAHHEEILATNQVASVDDNDLMVQVELEQKIHQAISDLPDQCQLIFKMSRLEGKRNQEIADVLKLSKRTVETQISKALKKLRDDIFQYVKLLIIMTIYFFW